LLAFSVDREHTSTGYSKCLREWLGDVIVGLNSNASDLPSCH